MRDGHDEQVIIKAYNTALQYCHRLTTDEICRGERLQHEKATPALIVWLARERLKRDPQTIENRWETVITKLTAEKRKAIEEEMKIQQEIVMKTPEIDAWFANAHNQKVNDNHLCQIEHTNCTS